MNNLKFQDNWWQFCQELDRNLRVWFDFNEDEVDKFYEMLESRESLLPIYETIEYLVMEKE